MKHFFPSLYITPKHSVTDPKGIGHKKGQPEVVIYVEKKGKERPTSPASNIATQGSMVVNMIEERNEIDEDIKEEYRSEDMIENLEKWAKDGRVEVDLIEAYLQRGYEWPLANIVKPNRKSQRRQLKKWIEKNKEKIDEKRSKKNGRSC